MFRQAAHPRLCARAIASAWPHLHSVLKLCFVSDTELTGRCCCARRDPSGLGPRSKVRTTGYNLPPTSYDLQSTGLQVCRLQGSPYKDILQNMDRS